MIGFSVRSISYGLESKIRPKSTTFFFIWHFCNSLTKITKNFNNTNKWQFILVKKMLDCNQRSVDLKTTRVLLFTNIRLNNRQLFTKALSSLLSFSIFFNDIFYQI